MAVALPENVFLTKLDAAANWARSNSLWPMPFATACCGIELWLLRRPGTTSRGSAPR